jgi:serine/threonine protein kinase
MKVCAFPFCYYNIKENVKKDCVDCTAFRCEGCESASYHSEFCRKLDKEHLKKCGGKKRGLESQDLYFKEIPSTKMIDSAETDDFLTSKDQRRQDIEVKHTAQVKDTKKDVIKLNNYEIFYGKTLGEGSYGRVVYGRELLTNSEVAIKIVNKEFLKSNSQAVLLKREIYIQRKLKHQNILSLRDCFEDTENVYLVLEYASGGSMFDYIQQKKGLSEKETFVFFLQVCLAVDTLHKSNIVHRDIKPENLLMDKAKNVKLCDFGCSFEFIKKAPKIRKTYCGTVDYMAPEFFRKQPHGMSADIWALGVLLFELAHSHPPYDVDDEDQKVDCILHCETKEINFKHGISEDFKDLVRMILRSEPKDRPKFDDIFSHPWTTKFGKKLNIDIDRVRFKDTIMSEWADQKHASEYFAKCDLRPTEVLMFADSQYLNNLEESQEMSHTGIAYQEYSMRGSNVTSKDSGREGSNSRQSRHRNNKIDDAMFTQMLLDISNKPMHRKTVNSHIVSKKEKRETQYDSCENKENVNMENRANTIVDEEQIVKKSVKTKRSVNKLETGGVFHRKTENSREGVGPRASQKEKPMETFEKEIVEESSALKKKTQERGRTAVPVKKTSLWNENVDFKKKRGKRAAY